MTSDELIQKLNQDYGTGGINSDPWPKTLEVDHETYANCCQTVFNSLMPLPPQQQFSFGMNYLISLGHNNGLMFKGVELLIKK